MPFDRYTLDPDGGYTFADSASGQTMRAAGQAAADRAAQLDYQQPPADSLYAPTAMVPPERGPDMRLAAAGPPVDLGEQAPIASGPPAPPPPMSPAQAERELARVAAPTERALGVPAAAAGRVAPPVVDGGDVDAPDFMTRPGPGQVRQGIAVDAAGKPVPISPATGQPIVTDAAGKPVGSGKSMNPADIDPAGAGGAPAAPADAGYDLAPVGQTTNGVSSMSGSSTQRSLGPDPKKLDALRKQETTQGDAEKKLIELQAGVAAEQEGVFEKDARAADENKFRIEMVNQETDDRMSKLIARRAEKLAAIEATPDVDPNRLWNNLDTGRKVGAIIGVALGGFSASSRGGENAALGMLQTAINRDIAQQQGSIDKKKGEFNLLGQAADDVRQLGGDRIAQAHAMRSAAADLAVSQVKRLAAKSEAAMGLSPMYDERGNIIPRSPVSLKAAAFIEKLKTSQRADDVALSERMRGTVTTQSQTTRSSQTTREDFAAVPRSPEVYSGPSVVLADEKGVKRRYAIRDLEAGEFQKTRDKASKLNALRRELVNMRGLYEKKLLPGFSDQYEAASQRAAASMSNIMDMGVLQKFDAEQAARLQSSLLSGRDVLGDIEAFAKSQAGDILDQSRGREIPLDDAPGGSAAPPRLLGKGGTEPKKAKK
jgi:hypothetical protein